MQNRSLIGKGYRTTSYYGKDNGYSYEVRDLVDAAVDQLIVFSDSNTGDRTQVHSHAFRKTVVHHFKGTTVEDNPYFLRTYEGYQREYIPTYENADYSNLYNQALSRLFDQIRSGVDFSVDGAQIGQTFSMLSQRTIAGDYMYQRMGRAVTRASAAMNSLVDFIKSFRPREWANRWLELQYGWKPLIGTIYDTLAHQVGAVEYSTAVLTGSASERKVGRKSTEYGLSLGRLVDDFSFTRQVKVVAEFKFKPGYASSYSNYTSLNPVSIGWELLPYSFVVDWVYDVGGYLRNLESALLFGSEFKRGYSVARCLDIQKGRNTSIYPYAGGTVERNWNATWRVAEKFRAPVGSLLPVTPRLNYDLGSSQLLSGAALLFQHLGTGPRYR